MNPRPILPSPSSASPLRPGPRPRRAFLADLGMGFTGLALGAMLAEDGIARAADRSPSDSHTLPPSHHAAKAKSVIWIFLSGGYSHVETFDPKPDAPMEYRGPFSPITTRTPGLLVSELLPKLAARSHKYAVVRSHVTSEPGHPDAGTVGLTGFKEKPDPVRPNFGSIIAKYRGHRGSLPPFVSVGRGIPRDVVRKVDGQAFRDALRDVYVSYSKEFGADNIRKIQDFK